MKRAIWMMETSFLSWWWILLLVSVVLHHVLCSCHVDESIPVSEYMCSSLWVTVIVFVFFFPLVTAICFPLLCCNINVHVSLTVLSIYQTYAYSIYPTPPPYTIYSELPNHVLGKESRWEVIIDPNMGWQFTYRLHIYIHTIVTEISSAFFM